MLKWINVISDLVLSYCSWIILVAVVDGRKMADAEPSPVWVPDSEAPMCMHCLKSEFTVINRRVSTSNALVGVSKCLLLG